MLNQRAYKIKMKPKSKAKPKSRSSNLSSVISKKYLNASRFFKQSKEYSTSKANRSKDHWPKLDGTSGEKAFDSQILYQNFDKWEKNKEKKNDKKQKNLKNRIRMRTRQARLTSPKQRQRTRNRSEVFTAKVLKQRIKVVHSASTKIMKADVTQKSREKFSCDNIFEQRKNINMADLKRLINKTKHHFKGTKSPDKSEKRRNIRLNFKINCVSQKSILSPKNQSNLHIEPSALPNGNKKFIIKNLLRRNSKCLNDFYNNENYVKKCKKGKALK